MLFGPCVAKDIVGTTIRNNESYYGYAQLLLNSMALALTIYYNIVFHSKPFYHPRSDGKIGKLKILFGI